LTRLQNASHFAKRLECGAFTAAFARTKVGHYLKTFPQPESGPPITSFICTRFATFPHHAMGCPFLNNTLQSSFSRVMPRDASGQWVAGAMRR
jgi:hypothetical protein